MTEKEEKMGKMVSLLIGAIITLLGLILLIAWWYEFIFVIKAIIPGMLILAGLVAVVAGLSEMKDVMKSSQNK